MAQTSVIVLTLVFGSVAAMLLTLTSALIALAGGMMLLTLGAGVTGVLTAVRDAGSTITRGHSLYSVNGKAAAFLLYGSLPAWRASAPVGAADRRRAPREWSRAIAPGVRNRRAGDCPDPRD